MTYSHPSPFPPSFEGNPWAYAFGLFGDVVAASLALAVLLAYLIEARRHREITALLGNLVRQTPTPRWSPLHLYRLGNLSILSFIVLRSLPDAVWMLAWGEVSESVIRGMLSADLVLDGVALAPFLVAMCCWAWGWQVIPQMLASDARAGIVGRVPWPVLLRSSRIVLVVMLIAIGVTIGKASA